MYIPTKFDSNWTSDFGEGNLNVKILKQWWQAQSDYNNSYDPYGQGS